MIAEIDEFLVYDEMLSLSTVTLTDCSTSSPVHVLTLSIQAVCGLPRQRAPGIVPCIISFSRQLPYFLMVWPYYANFLALTVSNSSLFTPALLRTHSFSLLSMKPAESFSVLISQRRQDFLHFFWVPSFHSRTLPQAILALSLVVSLLKSVLCEFSIFSAVMPQSPALCLTWYRIPTYTH